MRISFESSHVRGDFSDGRVVVGIERDVGDGRLVSDEIFFTVPQDFHVHNDCVATALQTLNGMRDGEVTFNFGISQHCADVLARAFRLRSVGPIDTRLRPRRPGPRLGLSFSGGFDSLAVFLLLRRSLRLVSCDFGGGFTREAVFFNSFNPHVACKTDLREKGFNRQHWSFMGAAAILHADYLQLGGLAFGGVLEATTFNLRADLPESPLEENLFSAAGLREVYVTKGLTEFGTAQVVAALAPELVEPSLISLAAPTTEKFFRKKHILRAILERKAKPFPAFLEIDGLPRQQVPFGENINVDFLSVYFVKRFGVEFWSGIVPGIEHLDWSFVEGHSQNLFFRYHTTFAQWVPERYRKRILDGLHRAGIYPYTERDWHELDEIRDFLATSRRKVESGVARSRSAGSE